MSTLFAKRCVSGQATYARTKRYRETQMTRFLRFLRDARTTVGSSSSWETMPTSCGVDPERDRDAWSALVRQHVDRCDVSIRRQHQQPTFTIATSTLENAIRDAYRDDDFQSLSRVLDTLSRRHDTNHVAVKDTARRLAYVNHQEQHEGYTMLMAAARRGRYDVVSRLLRLGASATIRNRRGRTAWDVAYVHRSVPRAFHDRVAAARAHMDRAIWDAFQDRARCDAFVPLAMRFNVYATDFQRPADGATMLMATCLGNRVDVARQLVRLGGTTQIMLRNKFGRTAVDDARSRGHAGLADDLLRWHAEDAATRSRLEQPSSSSTKTSSSSTTTLNATFGAMEIRERSPSDEDDGDGRSSVMETETDEVSRTTDGAVHETSSRRTLSPMNRMHLMLANLVTDQTRRLLRGETVKRRNVSETTIVQRAGYVHQSLSKGVDALYNAGLLMTDVNLRGLHEHVERLVDTFSFHKPVMSLTDAQWRLLGLHLLTRTIARRRDDANEAYERLLRLAGIEDEATLRDPDRMVHACLDRTMRVP